MPRSKINIVFKNDDDIFVLFVLALIKFVAVEYFV